MDVNSIYYHLIKNKQLNVIYEQSRLNSNRFNNLEFQSSNSSSNE